MGQKRCAPEQRCNEVYAFITEYVARNGYSPTFREVGDAVGIRSPATISRYIHMLVDEGRISIDESKPRTMMMYFSLDCIKMDCALQNTSVGRAKYMEWKMHKRILRLWKSISG